MASKLLRAVILGPPGSGKGTVCQRIAQNFGLQHLSSGHFLRENIKANTGEESAGVNRSGIGLGREDERPERGRVSAAGPPGALPPPACGLLRAGAHAAAGPRLCGLTAPGEKAEARWEEGGRCTLFFSPPGLLLPRGKAGNHAAEGQAAGDADRPLALPP